MIKMVLFVWSDWSFLTLYDVKLSKYSYVFEIALIMKIMDFIILKTLFSYYIFVQKCFWYDDGGSLVYSKKTVVL